MKYRDPDCPIPVAEWNNHYDYPTESALRSIRWRALNGTPGYDQYATAFRRVNTRVVVIPSELFAAMDREVSE